MPTLNTPGVGVELPFPMVCNSLHLTVHKMRFNLQMLPIGGGWETTKQFLSAATYEAEGS